MSSPAALAIATAAVDLTCSHPHAPVLDVLDLVMNGRANQVFDFANPTAVSGSLAAPFGQLLAAAFDEAMTPDEWVAFTRPTAAEPARHLPGDLAHARDAAVRCTVRRSVGCRSGC